MIIVEILAALGLTFILKQGTIFNKLRNYAISEIPFLKNLFDCGMCLGFWCGLFVAMITFKGTIDCFIFSLCVSFLGFITQHVLTLLCNNYKK